MAKEKLDKKKLKEEWDSLDGDEKASIAEALGFKAKDDDDDDDDKKSLSDRLTKLEEFVKLSEGKKKSQGNGFFASFLR